ncbi:ABC-three component system protein [Paraburkholderia tropica]|uniref:ABC-three component system protein n=1 Tax=Paraburkholderia tropica TaxID=92647 RepID=UPI002AB6AE31|nr:ABC-three component system protein [Paraburkholderia tropica]
MTADEIIAEALIPDTHSVFVLGSFEQRVTVFAQQVRALNLVDAILSRGLLQDTGSVAIVGGGAAGITAAVALARAAPNLKALDLFESRSNVLELQRNSSRYLHPHFYDWPNAGSDNPNAGLPLMNWTAGSAGEVAAALRAQFDDARRSSILSFQPDLGVTGINPSTISTVRVLVPGASPLGKIYDVVILAIGFGLEAFLDGETPSYWLPSQMSAALLTHQAEPLIFISGNGDGGLVDFLMSAFNAMEHRAICEFILGLDLGPAIAALEVIEQEAWAAGGAGLDLLALYRNRVLDLVPQAVWQSIIAQLRPRARIHFHTNEPRLLRRTTALHNRLAVFLVIEADRISGNNRVQITTDVAFDGAVPVTGAITLEGGTPFTPYRRFLRLGPDSRPNLKPFEATLSTFPSRVRASATRPESPQLTATARARFEAAAAAAPGAAPPPLVAAAAVAGESDHLLLRANGANIEWLSPVTPGEAERYWVGGRALAVYADISAADAGPLVAAIARIGAHVPGFVIRTRDAHGWRAAMNKLCAARELPGPDLAAPYVVHDWVAPPPLDIQATVGPALLAQTVHAALDDEMLRQLHGALHEILGPAAVEMGWPIEPALKARLWAQWEIWHGALLANAVTRSRFLLLLATEQDHADLRDGMLVRVGPKILRPFLTKPALFGLTFAVCSGHALAPAAGPPGNVATHGITGHACGVGWIGGRELGASCAMRQSWSTGIVLLAQLKDAFRLIEGELRFDRTAGDPPRVGMTSLGEGPLVIGADDVFVTALEAGEQSVQDYFQSIFRWRSEAAQAGLEEEAHG